MHTIVAERRIRRQISKDKLLEQVKLITSAAMKSGRGTGWKSSTPRLEIIQSGDLYIYRAKINFSTTSRRESLLKKWPKIVQAFAHKGASSAFKACPWEVVEPTGFKDVADDARKEHANTQTTREKANTPKTMGEICLDPGTHFARIYAREAQITRILGALDLAKRTEFIKRTHSVLDGDPGCGKTEIMRATAQMLGQENHHWMWFDATSMTKAGVIEQLINSEYVPPVLFIEEIEKCDENSLRWLLGVMDVRGQVRRTNYRVGNQAKDVRMVVIATANDVNLLKGLMSGALYSRFANKIYCPRPDREIMRRILEREIVEIKGKPEWIEPTLQFAFDKWGMTDPRDIITICSCGGDLLLSGKYQQDYEATMHPEEKESLLRSKDKAKKQNN